jgi:copper chaperone
MESSVTRKYEVKGMSCEHCRASVAEEVEHVSGVSDVAIDLATGELRVTGQGVSDDAVRAAVEEAGYEVAA